ncbi:MAG: cohesin domain-containing protein [Thermoguttaceae bacterium]|jgi:hypothetical protein
MWSRAVGIIAATLGLLATGLPSPARAQIIETFTVNSATGDQGTDVTVNVSLNPNNSASGIGSFTLNMSYDPSNLTFESGAQGSLLTGSGQSVSFTNPTGDVTVVGSASKNIKGTGDLFSMTFLVQPGATLGFTAISFTTGAQTITAGNGGDITSQSSFNNGGVNVVPEPSSLLLLGLVLPTLVLIRARSWLGLVPNRSPL